jgi:hypothetical protein
MTNCEKCGEAEKVFRVVVLAIQAGKGSRVGDKRGTARKMMRLRLKALCYGCLLTAEFRFTGAELRLSGSPGLGGG